jgi:hypothetical protein
VLVSECVQVTKFCLPYKNETQAFTASKLAMITKKMAFFAMVSQKFASKKAKIINSQLNLTLHK